MQHTIEQLAQQRTRLAELTSEILSWMDEAKLQRDGAAFAHAALSSLGGSWKAHVTTEDRMLYPELLHHPDARLRTLATQFWGEQKRLQRQFLAYQANWPSAASIAIAPAQFIEETQTMIGLLAQRMQQEDEVLHAEIRRACE